MKFILDPGLVLYLPLHKQDSSSFMSGEAYGHTCTVSGASWGMNGRNFDGADDYINCGNASVLQVSQAITIMAWINLLTPAGNRIIVGRRQGANNWQFYTTAIPKLGFTFWSGGVERTALAAGNSILPAGTWVLAAVTYDGANGNLYINGNIDKTASLTGTIDTNAAATTVGAGNTGGFQSWSGTIGEVGIYARALSPQEIQRNYLATKWRYR